MSEIKSREHFAVRNAEGKIVGRAVRMRPSVKNPDGNKFCFTYVDGTTGQVGFRVWGQAEMEFRFQAKGWEVLDSHLIASKPVAVAPGVFRIVVRSNVTEDWNATLDIVLDPTEDKSLRQLMSEKLVSLSQYSNCETHVRNWAEV
jgi:hypothetical protein